MTEIGSETGKANRNSGAALGVTQPTVPTPPESENALDPSISYGSVDLGRHWLAGRPRLGWNGDMHPLRDVDVYDYQPALPPGNSSMSEHAIEFLRGWIGEKVHCQSSQARIDKQAETLAKECAAEAAEVGIPLEDIQEEVGDIQELIASRLEEAAEAEESQQAPRKAAE
ncbi:hypothetical protein NKH52_20415 [Mesorhizobium sp. M1066]